MQAQYLKTNLTMKTIISTSFLLATSRISTNISVTLEATILYQRLFHDSKALISGQISLTSSFTLNLLIVNSLLLTLSQQRVRPLVASLSLKKMYVYLTICSLESSKATGPDGIGTNVLKSLLWLFICQFTLCLYRVLNSITFQGIGVSTKLCQYSTGDKTSVENYRPISLISNCSLVFECILHKNISDFVEKSIMDFQFGFL